MSGDFTITGGSRIGWVSSTWPLAKLSVTRGSLSISGFGSYVFEPSQVASLEPYGSIPFLGRGVRIVHTRTDYPVNIIFWCFGSPGQLIERIRQAGFVPSASAASIPVRSGIPVRPLAIVIAIVVWNVLFLLDNPTPLTGGKEPGLYSLVALGLLCWAVWVLPNSQRLQSLVLKPGRSIGEIRSFLSLARLIGTCLFVGFLVAWAFKWIAD